MEAGVRHIDAVSFVSPAAVPQMADSERVLELLGPVPGVEIIGIVVNAQGAERAIATGAVQTLGFPYSISPRFLARNQRQTQPEALHTLAVIHHLILREQAPLAHIGDLCASLTRRWLALEWVPPLDPMFQEWLRGRDDLYGRLSEDDLRRAFAPFFHVADRTVLGNRRVLLLFECNDAVVPHGGTSLA